MDYDCAFTFNAAGLIAYGLGPYYGAHWAISVIIGQGFWDSLWLHLEHCV